MNTILPKNFGSIVKEYLHASKTDNKIIWEAFSGKILSNLGCTVIQSNVDFF